MYITVEVKIIMCQSGLALQKQRKTNKRHNVRWFHDSIIHEYHVTNGVAVATVRTFQIGTAGGSNCAS
jgi:hypothetical protein